MSSNSKSYNVMAPRLGVTVISVSVGPRIEFETAFAAMMKERPDAFAMTGEPFQLPPPALIGMADTAACFHSVIFVLHGWIAPISWPHEEGGARQWLKGALVSIPVRIRRKELMMAPTTPNFLGLPHSVWRKVGEALRVHFESKDDRPC